MGQADQGDLESAKERYAHKNYPECRQAINKTFETAPPAGSRYRRPIERARTCFSSACLDHSIASDEYGPGSILASYLVEEEIWAKEIERMKLERQKASERGVQEII